MTRHDGDMRKHISILMESSLYMTLTLIERQSLLERLTRSYPISMTKWMLERKTTLNKTDWGESGKLWKTVGNRRAEDTRREAREHVIGDILWSYVADKDENRFKGTIMDKSHNGLCILTLAPITVGSILRIHVKDRGAVIGATVIWCKKGSADIYKSGLLLGE